MLKLLEVLVLVNGYRGVLEDTYRTSAGEVMTKKESKHKRRTIYDHAETDAGLAGRWITNKNHCRFRA